MNRPAEVGAPPGPVSRPTEVTPATEPIARPASAPPAISTERATPPPTTELGGGHPVPPTSEQPAVTEHAGGVPATADQQTVPVPQELPAPPPERPAATPQSETPPPAGPPPRTPPPRMKLDRTPRFVVRSGFDQRDFSHDGTPYTDLTVRIAFRGGDPADYAGTFERAQQGVEQYFNQPGYRLPNGNRLHVTVEPAAPHEQPHLTVTVVGQDHGMDQRNWPPHASPISYAHEIGHQLGLRDEYRDASNPNRAHVPGSLLGDYHSPSEHGLPLGGLGDRHLQLLNALTGGGSHTPAPAHGGEPAGGHLPGGDEVTPRMPDPAPTASLHDHVPQDQWWKLYIDPKNHATALERFPDDPGSFYDNDRSPGYQQGMVSAYRQFLGDPEAAHTPLTAGAYQTIHDLAVSNLGQTIDWSGGRPTHFPLRGMQLSGDMFHETVDGRPLVYDLTKHDWSKKLTGPKPVTIMTNVMFKNHALSTNYGRGEAPGLVDSVFRRHYDTVGQPGVDDHTKLGSIASTIRALHVIHPFEDGNLRTNVQIVLPKLLLEQGFRPIVPDDMYTIFQGGHSVEQMVESLVRNGATEGLPHSAPGGDAVAPKAPVLPPDPVTAEDAGRLYGMPKGNFTKFQQIARQKNLVIDVRPTNPESVKWLEQGMLPKPMDIKAKTINVLDTHLGADPEHQGLVGYFKPTLPTERPPGMDDGAWNRLQQRYHQRADEFEQLAPKMQKLADQDKFHVQEGLVKGYNGEGRLTAITGDHDIFDISTPGGSQLTPHTYQHTVDEMIANNMAVAHGAHMYWPEPRSPFSQGIYEKIVTSHAEPDGEPLVRFQPGDTNSTQLAWSRPPAGSGEAAPKAPGPMTATETEAPGPHAPQEARPSWQQVRDQTPPVLRQHAWVDPVSDPHRTEMPQPEPRPEPRPELQPAYRSEPPTEPLPAAHVEHQEQAQPTPVEAPPVVEERPPTPEEHIPAQTPTPTSPVDPTPPVAAPRHQQSLAGLKITDDPGPGAIRDRIGAILGDHRDEQQVQQRLNVQLDPANFRTQHPQMVDGGWRFPITVDGRPHEVQIEATPSPWQGTPGTAKDGGADIEASSAASYAPEPRKVDTTSTETGLDFGPSGSIPVNPHLNALVTGSVSVGGVSHAANTTVKSATESPNKVTLTGATDNHSSTFTYHVRVVDDHGTPLPHPADAPPITGEVKADIPRADPGPDPLTPPRAWNGWNPTPGTHPSGRPLTVTGLGGVRDAVFQHLPDEQRPDGLAHRPILDFLDAKNVVNGFEHASSWGLDSPQMTFSDGRTGYLRLTLHPQDSTVVDTVDHKTSLGAKSTTEHSGSQGNNSSRALGASGGASGEVWASDQNHETKWLTGTAGYSYAATTAHQAKLSNSLTTQSSHERAGTSDLVATRVHFQVEVIKNHLAPGTDGLRATRGQTVGLRDPLPEPQPHPDHLAITMEHPIAGEALRLVPAPPTAHPTPDAAPGTAHELPHEPPHEPAPPPPPSAADLRVPQTAQRTSFLDVPGSAELEQHILTRAHQQAPGLLPPPRDAAAPTGGGHRVTPQAMENLRILHQQLSPSALRGGGGKLLDGSYRITLDTSHLPGFPGRTYEITLQAHLDHGRATHLGSADSTSKSSLGLKTGADKQIGSGGKHTVSVSGNLRSSLNPPDTGRAFLNASADGSYSRTHQLATGSESEVKREFTLESPADSFGYPVRYDVRIGPQGATHEPSRLPIPDGRPLVAEVRPPATPETPPPTRLPGVDLPAAHLVTDVGDADAFRRQADAALGSAFEAKGDRRPPELTGALDSLTGPDQLRGQISASHHSWSNSGIEHVGSGRNRDAVGLSTRTVLSGLTYRETLPGQGKLSVETKSGSATTVVDKWSGGVKGGLGPDFVRYPENPQGLHESTYQVRAGFKGKASVGRDGNDSLKSQVTTSHKTTTPKGTWHVYEADAQVTTTGRVVDASGRTHYGQPQRSDHRVLVLLSDEDVHRLATEGPTPPPQRHVPLLDAGLPAGATVHFQNTDGILHEIDAQLRGPRPDREVPLRALPFANTFSPDNLSAHYADLVGKGILDYHVEETRAGRTVTEVLVQGVPREAHWQDEGQRSESDTTRTVTSARTAKGNSGESWSAGADVNASASLRTPRAVDHLSNANYGPSAGGEAGRTSGAESGVTAKTEQKTGKYGPSLAFSNGMDFRVVVTQRTDYGRFVHLPKGPGTVPHPGRVTAWVPESTTRPVDATPLDTAPLDTTPPGTDHPDPAPPGEPQGPGLPGGIPLGPVPPADAAHWQQQLDSGHDVVGFDHAGALLDNAGAVLNAPRPWSNTLLGRAGETTSAVLGTGANWLGGAMSTGAHAVLPKALTDMGHRVVNSFVSDPRLNGDGSGAVGPLGSLGGDVQGEQRQPLPQRLGVRQVFSAQSLPSVLQQAKASGGHHETVTLGADGATKLRVSVTPTGPAVEVSARPNGEDEITVTTEDASGTSATSTHSFSAGLANFSLTTNKPVVTLPFNGPKLTGEGASDRTAPVTRTPGQPSVPQPPATLPHGLTAGEAPGKAELKGPQALMRQPVRVSVQRTDAGGPYGAAVPTDGHLYYWAAKPTETAVPEPPVEHPAETHTPAPPQPPTPPRAESPEPEPAPAPTPPQPIPHETSHGTSHSTPAPAPPLAPHTDPLPVDAGHDEPVVIRLSSGDGRALPPDQLAALHDTAAQLADLTAQRTQHGEPPPSVTVTASAAVHHNGVPHYGRSLSLANQRARSVGDALNSALAERGTSLEITLDPQVSRDPETPGDHPYALVVSPRAPRAPQAAPPSPPPRPSSGPGSKDWTEARAAAPVAVVDTEHFDPSRLSTASRLDGSSTRITYDLRQFEPEPGVRVKDFTIRLHVEPGPGAHAGEALDVFDRARAAVDAQFNNRYTLPDGSRLQVHLERTDDPATAHQTVTVRPGEGRADQLTWYTGSRTPDLVHEVGHFLGLRDEYPDPEALFHRADPPGSLMGGAVRTDDHQLLDGHLTTIDRITRSGPVVRELTYHQFQELRSAGAAPTHPQPAPHVNGGHQPPHAPPHVAPRSPEEVRTVLATPPHSEPAASSPENRRRGEALGNRYDRVSLIDPGSDGTGHQTGYLRFLDGLAATGYRGEVHLTYVRTKTPFYAKEFGHRGSLEDPSLSYGLFHETWHGGYKGLDVVMHPVGPDAHPPFRGAPQKLAGDVRTYWTQTAWKNADGPTPEQLGQLGGWQKKAYLGDQLPSTQNEFHTSVMRRTTDSTVISIAPGSDDLSGSLLSPGPRTLTVFAAFDAPHDADPATFFRSTPLPRAIATMTHEPHPDVLILEPFLWDHHQLQIHHGDEVTDLGAAIREKGAFPSYHWQPPARPADVKAHVDQHWTADSSHLPGAQDAVGTLLAQARSGDVRLATAYYGDTITGALPHGAMLQTLGKAMTDPGIANDRPSVLVLLGGSADGGLAASAAAELQKLGHPAFAGPQALHGAGPGDVVLLELGRVPSEIMTSFERHSDLFVTEGASTWQELLTLGTTGISARPDGDTQPWSHQVPGTDLAAGELVAKASRALMAGDTGPLAAFISALNDPDSPVRAWVESWSAALQNPAGDQVMAAIDHLLALSGPEGTGS
ncbi:hypothetical protein [Streptacidiphilus jiangxiensis]|uniref:hypothetical protein n=1 Tax=Streptacidiphilus jiangxiensis TaxID=235985 RepID=UPI0005A85BA5|nr:hypothetical protein [Streptacidiphilus jiangxiensis]